MRGIAICTAPFTLTACSLFGDNGPVSVGAFGTLARHPDPAAAILNEPNALLVDGTARGLVGFDADGQIEAGLAGRWTVIDDGRSYIFRLRDARWADGRRVVAADVVALLQRRVDGPLPAALRGEFSAIESIRAMTEQVIEIRLTRAQPHLLDLLASPAMGLRRRAGGWGPLAVRWDGGTAMLRPVLRAADAPEADTVEDEPPALMIWGGSAANLIAQYVEGDIGVVMGGHFDQWPYLAAAGIDAGDIRRDPVAGLFGLAVVADNGLLTENLARDAVAMAINRSSFIAALDVQDWAAQAAIRPPSTDNSSLARPYNPAWIEFSMAERRRRARAIVQDWRSRNGNAAPVLRIALPPGPGSAILYAHVRRDLGSVGIATRRVNAGASADLRLIDEVAPISGAAWYLRRIGCNRGLMCDRTAQPLIDAISETVDDDVRAQAIARADEALTRFGAFIPLALPLRWTLAPRAVDGLRPNVRGRHSLIRLIPSPD